jgi:flagellar hook-associated protein 2
METNFVNALGAGSGIDTKSLATNLVEAERVPLQKRIEAKITQSENKISGYGALKFSLSDIQSAFGKINDASDFQSLTVSNSQTSSFSVSTSGSPSAGSLSVEVMQVAKGQMSSSATLSSSLNNGSPLVLTISQGSGTSATSQALSITDDSPAGVVTAINNAALGLKAQLVTTSSGQKIMVSGAAGAANTFQISAATTDSPATDIAELNFSTTLRAASDAIVDVNGTIITSSSNTLSNVATGVSLQLYGQSNGVAQVELTRQTSSIKDNLKALVTSFNTFEDSVKVLADRKSTVETFGGALAGDTLLQSVRSQVKEMFTNTSSTPGTTIKALRDVGLSIDRYGKLNLDEAKLDDALTNHFDEVVQMFTANVSGQSVYSQSSGGIAGDAFKKLDKMQRSTGLIQRQSATTEKTIAKQKEELTKLEERMTKLLERYTTQFGAMDAIVGESTATRASLKTSFEGMMAMYKNN